MRKETFKAGAWGTLFTLIVAGLIVAGLTKPRALRRCAGGLYVRRTLCHLRHHLSIFDVVAASADRALLEARLAGLPAAAIPGPKY